MQRFNSIIVNSLGFTLEQTTLLGIPTDVFSWISSLVFGYIAVKTRQRCLSAMGSCILPFVGTILLYKIPRTDIGGSLAALYLVYFYWGPYIVMMGSVYANTGGYTKKMIVYAIGEYVHFCLGVNYSLNDAFIAYVGYSVGNIIGPVRQTLGISWLRLAHLELVADTMSIYSKPLGLNKHPSTLVVLSLC